MSRGDGQSVGPIVSSDARAWELRVALFSSPYWKKHNLNDKNEIT